MTQGNGNGHKRYSEEERNFRRKRSQDAQDCKARVKNGERIFDVQLDDDTAAALTWIVTGKSDEPAKLRHDAETRRGLGEFLKHSLSKFLPWCESDEAKKLIAENAWSEMCAKAIEKARAAPPISVTYREYSDGSITADYGHGELIRFPKGEHQVWAYNPSGEKVFVSDLNVKFYKLLKPQ